MLMKPKYPELPHGQSKPLWLLIAEADLGLRELPGAPTAPKIQAWLQALNAWWSDDATPWCGTAVAAWTREAGYTLPKHWYRAKGWLDWGFRLEEPAVGCVVVLDRKGGGHVGLFAGYTPNGDYIILGGNQGDMVSYATFSPERMLGHVWPLGMQGMEALRRTPDPTVWAVIPKVSTNEA